MKIWRIVMCILFLRKLKGDVVVLQPVDLIFPEDVAKLPSSMIEEACLLADIPFNSSTSGDAIYNILNSQIPGDRDLKVRVYELIKNKIFASRRGITWHRLPQDVGALDIETAFRDHLGISPFEALIPRDPNNLNGTAKVMGACRYGENRRYLIRLMVKVRVQKFYAGPRVENRVIGGTITAILDLDNGILEIRDDPKYSTRILRELSQVVTGVHTGSIISPRIAELLDPYGGNVEDFADNLDGRLISTDSKPELDFEEELTSEQITAVSNVLIAVNDFFDTNDYEILQTKLDESKASLTGFEDVPFLAILLAGMEKLGLRVRDVADVRTQPLLNALKPHLQYQGGFIKFPVNENGVNEYHTIRIGLQTNSISFRTFATENAIEKVRRALL
ncbi:MAG: hypothetical protein ACYDEJ_02290 [Desulfitobacteriaceae bacterium]